MQSEKPPRTALQRPATFILAPAPDGAASNADAVEVGDILRVLRLNRGLILKIAGVVFALAMGFVLLTKPRFTSTGRMYLGELEDKDSKPSGPRSDELDLMPGGRGDMGSEIEILKSRSLVTKAILATGLNATVSTSSWSPPRYWRWLASLRSQNMIDVAARELAAVDTRMTDRAASYRTFDVLFTTAVDYEVRVDGKRIGQGRLGDLVQCDGLAVRLVPGTERAPIAGARYQVDVESLDDMVDAAVNYNRTLDVSTPTSKAPSSVETIKVANLSYTAKSPAKAAAFLDRLMLGYLEERQAWKTENALAAESFVTAELAKTRQKLDELQDKMAAYRSANGVVVLDDAAKAIVEEEGQYEQQRVAAQVEVQSLALVRDQLRAPHPPLEAFMIGEAKDDTVLVGLASNLSQSQQQLAEAEARYNDPAPTVQTLRAQVDAQLTAIRSYVSRRLVRAQDTLRTLDGVIVRYDQKLKTVPAAQVGLARLTRETEVHRAMYSLLLRQQQEAGLTRASTISKDRVLDAPEAPYREDFLRLGVGLGTLPFGLVLGSIFVLIRSATSSRLQHAGDVSRYLGDVPVFAQIPRMAYKGDRLSTEYVEAFRTLRAKVLDACRRERGNVLVFTSPSNKDGKTTCAYFLASILARSGRSVLLVDTNLPRDARGEPSKAIDKAKAREPGLGDVLAGSKSTADVVQQIVVSEDCAYDAVPSGTVGTTDLLASQAMSDFMATARDDYDFVIIEAPSYPAISDTVVLSTFSDCVIAVVRLEHTSRALAVEAFDQVSTTSAKFGVILNDVRN